MIDLTPAFERVQSMIEGLIAQVPNLLVALVVLVIFWLVGNVTRRVVQRFSHRTKLSATAEAALGRLLRALIILLGLLVAFTIIFPGITAGQMIEILGIGGVAIGFAFRDILQNFLAGILIFLTQPFKIGDQIVYSGFEGTIEDIQTRATLMLTYDGRQVVIPNADLFTNAVIVNTAYPVRRTEYDVGIGYGDDIDLARRLMVEAALSAPEVRREPLPDAFVVRLDESAVTVRVRWWTDSHRGEVIRSQGNVLQAIKKRLYDEAGIDLPYATQVVLFHDQTDETDGDRAVQREGWPLRDGESLPRPRRIVDALYELVQSQKSG